MGEYTREDFEKDKESGLLVFSGRFEELPVSYKRKLRYDLSMAEVLTLGKAALKTEALEDNKCSDILWSIHKGLESAYPCYCYWSGDTPFRSRSYWTEAVEELSNEARNLVKLAYSNTCEKVYDAMKVYRPITLSRLEQAEAQKAKHAWLDSLIASS